ncbi:MAG: hypothetical protein ACX93N_15865 [Pseudohaliea sp.]
MRDALAPLLLLLLLGAPLAGAQAPEEADATPAAPPAAEDGASATGGEGDAEGGPRADPPPVADDSSPFDYQASEEISEDLSVSFPVDI